MEADQKQSEGLIEKATTNLIIESFFEVYNEIRYGFREAPYCDALELELMQRGFVVDREFPVPIFYKHILLRKYRLDFVVQRKVIVEVKAGENLPKGALQQLSSYLAATEFEVGLLLYFGPEPKFFRRVHSKH